MRQVCLGSVKIALCNLRHWLTVHSLNRQLTEVVPQGTKIEWEEQMHRSAAQQMPRWKNEQILWAPLCVRSVPGQLSLCYVDK